MREVLKDVPCDSVYYGHIRAHGTVLKHEKKAESSLCNCMCNFIALQSK